MLFTRQFIVACRSHFRANSRNALPPSVSFWCWYLSGHQIDSLGSSIFIYVKNVVLFKGHCITISCLYMDRVIINSTGKASTIYINNFNP